jgi:two-component system chemotaxis response regulator CheY
MTKTALVVDDSPSMRRLVASVLSGAGYTVVEAEDGKVGLQHGAVKVDVIITDLNMPVMDGMVLTERLRKETPNKFTPILVLTTEMAPERKAQAKAAGATGWLVKPFDPTQLLDVLRRVGA